MQDTNTCFYSFCVFTTLLAHLSDIRLFYSRYPTMHKVHMYAGATRQLLYECARTGDNRLAKARGLSSRTYAQTIQ